MGNDNVISNDNSEWENKLTLFQYERYLYTAHVNIKYNKRYEIWTTK